VIPWQFVDLIETDPARRVKLKIAYEGLSKMHPADIADIVEDLPPAEREAVFETIDEGGGGGRRLEEIDPQIQVSIVESLDSNRAGRHRRRDGPDAAADLLADLPEGSLGRDPQRNGARTNARRSVSSWSSVSGPPPAA
jgi:Mg/Co/Ni transporter MgtE